MSDAKPKGISKPVPKVQEPTMDDLQAQLNFFAEEEQKIKQEQEEKLKAVEEKRKSALETIKVREEQDKSELASKFVPIFDMIRRRGYSIPEMLRRSFNESKIEGYFISVEDPNELNKKIRSLESKIKKQESSSDTGKKRTRLVSVRYNKEDFESSNPQHLSISFGGAGNRSIKGWWDKLSDEEKELNKVDVDLVDSRLAFYILECAKRQGIKTDSKKFREKYPSLFEAVSESLIIRSDEPLDPGSLGIG